MSTLYEITGDYLRLLQMLEEDESIDEQAFKDALKSIEGEFEIKADGYARIIKELNAEEKKFKVEIERMTAKMNVISNNTARLKQHLFDSMKATGKTKFKTNLFSFNIQKNGGLQPLEIADETKIPKRYMKMVPDNKKIREALESGQQLHFATLGEQGEHLSIR